jgi:hypothetical protein
VFGAQKPQTQPLLLLWPPQDTAPAAAVAPTRHSPYCCGPHKTQPLLLWPPQDTAPAAAVAPTRSQAGRHSEGMILSAR